MLKNTIISQRGLKTVTSWQNFMSFISIYRHFSFVFKEQGYRGCLVAAATLFTFGYLWLDLNDVCVCVLVAPTPYFRMHVHMHMCLRLCLPITQPSAGQTWRIASQAKERTVLASVPAFNCFATENRLLRKQGAHCVSVFISTHLIFSADH